MEREEKERRKAEQRAAKKRSEWAGSGRERQWVSEAISRELTVCLANVSVRP